MRKLVSLFALVCLLAPFQPSLAFAQTATKTPRKVMVKVPPEYPDIFKNGHFQAKVVAEATVLPNGSVSHVDVKSGNPMFAELATKALIRWKYAPGPDKTIEEVTFNFNSTPN